MVHNEEAASTQRRRTSSSAVWDTFTKNLPAAAGDGSLTATCRECGQTLRAGSTIGTSHLRRHIRTKRCHKLAAKRLQQRQRQRQLTAPPSSLFTAEEASPPPGDQDDHSISPPAPLVYVEEEFFVVDGIDIAELYDDLVDKDLANIDDDEPSRADEDFSAANCCYVPAVPQAASSSTRWFRHKKMERKVAESKKGKDEQQSGLDLLSAQGRVHQLQREEGESVLNSDLVLLPCFPFQKDNFTSYCCISSSNSAAATATIQDPPYSCNSP